MRFALMAAAALFLFAALALAYYAGAVSARKRILRDLVVNKDYAELLTRAANFINRLVRIGDLDGPYAANILSPEGNAEATEWLADYRKSLELK